MAKVDDTLRGMTGYLLKRAYMVLHEDATRVLAEEGLRVRSFSALCMVVDRPDLTQSQLAAAMGIERSGMVVIIDELESRELIRRDPVPGDRRSYALRATLKGTRLAQKLAGRLRAEEGRRLTPDQRAALQQALQPLLNSGAELPWGETDVQTKLVTTPRSA